ncbi:MAG: hypothetical protein JWM11_4619 [Planctomycetaceae bacterium]|nr:hypothetical protein [Planctomycetaceae bacterium]
MPAIPTAPNSKPTRSSSKLVLLMICLAIVGGLAGWWLLSPGPKPIVDLSKPGDKIGKTPQERAELLAFRNQAIGHLENEEWFPALQVLRQIEKKLPQDLFALRNMAVAMCGKKSFGGNDLRPIQPEEAEAAAQLLLNAAPKDYVSHILAARIAVGCRQPELALERFRSASQLAPQNANPWFELYRTFATGYSKEIPAEAFEAIKNCQHAAPNNIIATSEYAKILAEKRDPELLELLRSKTQMFEQLRRFVQRESLDPNKYIDQAVALLPEAIQSQTTKAWSAVANQTGTVCRVIMALEVYKSDLDRLQPNPLDFMSFRFSTSELNDEPEPVSPLKAIDVSFLPAAKQIVIGTAPLSIQVADFNLDHQPDLFVLSAGKLQVFGVNAPPAKETNDSNPKPELWQLLTEIAVDVKLTGFVVADLDLDAVDLAPPSPIRPVPNSTGAKPAPAPKSKKVKLGDATTYCQQADPDLILYGPAGIQIWKNEIPAQGTARAFVKAEKTGLEDVRNVELVCAADFDLEGDLDLIALHPEGLTLWSNREQFTFKDVSKDSVLPQGLHLREIIPVDWDHDVDLDFVLIGEPVQKSSKPLSICGVLRNQLHGALKWDASLDGSESSAVPEISNAAILDSDANASWDLVLTSPTEPRLISTVNSGPGNVKLLNETAVPTVLSEGVRVLDYDNDGYLDLLSWKGKSMQIVRGRPTGQFSEPVFKLPDSNAVIRDCHVADFDNDGDLDLCLLLENGIQLLTNNGGNQNHWLKVRLRAEVKKDTAGTAGQQSKRVNHQGVGSLVELKTQAYYQPQVASGEVIHFGLGAQTKAELLRVVWTNGIPQGLLDLEGNVEICEVQAPKGSCPFVYTWNGEHFEFYTDLLWNAPLGLQFAEGVVAQPRAWEYLKIPGERMQLKDGKYVLQVTEELWEATYFDQIELLAIDHPAEIEIYSNEKVGPAELAEFKIHTVLEPHSPVAAIDQRGRDVLQQVVREDGEFTKTYDRKFRQGLTEEHWLELDLGKIEKSGAITLFLTGWMYPTETSISVAVSQNPENAQARPPALWVPNANGEWKEIRPFMGFPGGKTKTIAIDLTGAFAGPDHRLRIVTNMEFYWDHAFYSVGEKPVTYNQASLQMKSADLHHRGVSQHYWRPGNGPDQYDYRYVTSDPVWPPMQGHFTRFGDVLELLTQQDDRLVVIGAGDEITLTFAAPHKPIPAGWKRDFIMHNVGWDKDADLHTLYGQTVEPLPFNAMSGYPFDAHETPRDTTAYRHYLEQYQTRQQSHSRFWNWARRGQQSEPLVDQAYRN